MGGTTSKQNGPLFTENNNQNDPQFNSSSHGSHGSNHYNYSNNEYYENDEYDDECTNMMPCFNLFCPPSEEHKNHNYDDQYYNNSTATHNTKKTSRRKRRKNKYKNNSSKDPIGSPISDDPHSMRQRRMIANGNHANSRNGTNHNYYYDGLEVENTNSSTATSTTTHTHYREAHEMYDNIHDNSGGSGNSHSTTSYRNGGASTSNGIHNQHQQQHMQHMQQHYHQTLPKAIIHDGLVSSINISIL